MTRCTGCIRTLKASFLMTPAVLLQMVSRAMLALVAVSLVAVASADINTIVGNFALNLVSIHAPARSMHSHRDMLEVKNWQDVSEGDRLFESRKDLSDLRTGCLWCMQPVSVAL